MSGTFFDPKNFTYEQWESLLNGIEGDMYGVLVAASPKKRIQGKTAYASKALEGWYESRRSWWHTVHETQQNAEEGKPC